MINSNNNISFCANIRDIPKLNIPKRVLKLNDAKLNGYTAFINGKIYDSSNKIKFGDILLKNNQIIAINEFDENSINGIIKYVDIKDKILTPTLIDEHIHGGYGVNFHSSDEKSIRKFLKQLAKEGTGAILATTLPGTLEHLNRQLKILNHIIKNPDKGAAKILGIHLEGPFLNPKKAGIHPPEALLKPSIENFEKLDSENVKIVTLAPELDQNYELSKYLKNRGIIPSAGHSMADASDIKESGITQVTHLFNAMAPFHHRLPTVANEGLLNPKITAEMNTDTSLLVPDTMNLIMREKPKDKLILISDALPQAGIKKDFLLNGIRIHVNPDWIATSDRGILAGSMKFLHDVAAKLIKETNMTFEKFIRYASVNPAKNLGVENDYKIAKGSKPDFAIWDKNSLKVEKTFIN